MLKTKYDVLVRNGRERFIVIPEKEYEALRERLADEADFRAIEASKKRQARSLRYSLEKVRSELELSKNGKKRKE